MAACGGRVSDTLQGAEPTPGLADGELATAGDRKPS